jgi:Icc-related predicted phosphoesterase
MKIVALSDIHGFTPEITEEGDVLLFAGDILKSGTLTELSFFKKWVDTIKDQFDHVIVVPGNHDRCFEEDEYQSRSILKGIRVLINQGCAIDGVKFYGSPNTPKFFDWAFMKGRAEMDQVWQGIPDDTQVLVTHGPAFGILDQNKKGERCGCESLYMKIKELPELKAHIFGHIHEAYGHRYCGHHAYNVAILDHKYRVAHSVTIIDV